VGDYGRDKGLKESILIKKQKAIATSQSEETRDGQQTCGLRF
jgi:hypothetical protein